MGYDPARDAISNMGNSHDRIPGAPVNHPAAEAPEGECPAARRPRKGHKGKRSRRELKSEIKQLRAAIKPFLAGARLHKAFDLPGGLRLRYGLTVDDWKRLLEVMGDA